MTPLSVRRRCAVLAIALVAFAAPIGRTAEIPAADRKSTYELMSPATRAMQDDDTSNPGMLWVLDGEALWSRKTGSSGQTCAGCHGEASQSMKGVAARYPAFDAASGRPIDLEQRIIACRTERQGAPAPARESKELLALTAYVARQSRGMPIEDVVARDEKLTPFLAAGRTLFETRQGQLNLSCAQCHEDNWGRSLAGTPMPQGHATGYPIYRLEWQNLGSLQRRLRNCMIGMRAEAYTYGAPEYVELQLYLAWRARGMPLETPGVRP
jgi:sulfur-oxidizing protein SoxA